MKLSIYASTGSGRATCVRCNKIIEKGEATVVAEGYRQRGVIHFIHLKHDIEEINRGV